jgi:hypothetical protein
MFDFLDFCCFNLFSPIFHYGVVKISINLHENFKVLKFKGFMSSFQIHTNNCCVLFKRGSHTLLFARISCVNNTNGHTTCVYK